MRLLVLGLLSALLSGCLLTGGIEDDLEDLPGVRAAAVDRRALDTDYYSLDLAVDMEQQASAEEVADVLDAIQAWSREDRVEEHSSTLTVGSGETRMVDPVVEEDWPSAISGSATKHDDNLARARLLLEAGEVFDSRVLVDEGGWTVYAENTLEALRTILATPRLARAPGLHVEDHSSRFTSAGPLRESWVRAFEKSLAATRTTVGAEALLSSFGSPEDGGVDLDDPAGPDIVEVVLILQVRSARAPGELLSPPERDPQWPAVRAQLDVLRDLPPGSRLWASLQYDPIGHDFRKTVDLVYAGTDGVDAETDRKILWNEAATAYLARRASTEAP